MKKNRHNPYFIDKITRIYLLIRWDIPYKIISLFIKDNLRKKHYIRIYHKYFIGWWFGILMHLTIYKRRPCVRRLRYIGYRDFDMTDDEKQKLNNDIPFFKLGSFYVSRSFNSTTYTIEGYDNYIGAVYCDVV